MFAQPATVLQDKRDEAVPVQVAALLEQWGILRELGSLLGTGGEARDVCVVKKRSPGGGGDRHIDEQVLAWSSVVQPGHVARPLVVVLVDHLQLYLVVAGSQVGQDEAADAHGDGLMHAVSVGPAEAAGNMIFQGACELLIRVINDAT